MDWEAIGALGELIGSLAVIVSILYLSVQIRSNSRIALASSERELMHDWKDINATLSNNPQLAKIWLKGGINFDDLDQFEKQQFSALCEQYVVYHLNAMRMHENGFFDEEMLRSTDRALLMVLTCDGGKKWWAEYGKFHPEQHYEYISKLIDDNPEWNGYPASFIDDDT